MESVTLSQLPERICPYSIYIPNDESRVYYEKHKEDDISNAFCTHVLGIKTKCNTTMKILGFKMAKIGGCMKIYYICPNDECKRTDEIRILELNGKPVKELFF